jgi:hypothetical protein
VNDQQPSWVDSFRCLGRVGGPYVIEVPVRLALENPELSWVLERWRRGDVTEGPSTDITGPVDRIGLSKALLLDPISGEAWEVLENRGGDRMIHVPHEIWQERTTVGARWDSRDAKRVLEKARSLGWRDE